MAAITVFRSIFGISVSGDARLVYRPGVLHMLKYVWFCYWDRGAQSSSWGKMFIRPSPVRQTCMFTFPSFFH